MEKMKQEPVMVTIRCLAYNHEPYIRECLEGFVMQKTNFKFEAIVHDDASTDKTADIIREYAEKYPDIIKPIYEKENLYSKHNGSLGRIIDQASSHSKYVAYCEGDDYWTDPFKLQKQVDIFESNDHISLVYTNFETVDKNGMIVDRPRYDRVRRISKSGNAFFDLLEKGNFVMTLSTMYRQTILQSPLIAKSPARLDYLLSVVAAGLGDIYYINEKTCCYRWTPTGLMETKMHNIEIALCKIKHYAERCYIDGKFRQLPYKLEKKIVEHYLRSSINNFRKGIDRKELICFLKQYPRFLPKTLYVTIKYSLLKIIKNK